ncbi:two-pore potassium channel 3-like [Tasmannia lanceolata]|uniref:two-pore potassium channel 3-like n=1 Tax=Tasmannia lanceolata TaxID=3420 RepID=UPI004062E194
MSMTDALLNPSEYEEIDYEILPLQPHSSEQRETAPIRNAQGQPQSRINTYILFVFYLCVGMITYWGYAEYFDAKDRTHVIVDGLYFWIVTMCTVGYGDISPKSMGMEYSEKLGYVLDIEEPNLTLRTKAIFVTVAVLVCIVIGSFVLHFVEEQSWVDSMYASIMSITTVGYGDRAFRTFTGRLFAAFWLLISTTTVILAMQFFDEGFIRFVILIHLLALNHSNHILWVIFGLDIKESSEC